MFVLILSLYLSCEDALLAVPHHLCVLMTEDDDLIWVRVVKVEHFFYSPTAALKEVIAAGILEIGVELQQSCYFQESHHNRRISEQVPVIGQHEVE